MYNVQVKVPEFVYNLMWKNYYEPKKLIEKWRSASLQGQGEKIHIEDDHGCSLDIILGSISAILVEDYGKCGEAIIEREMFKFRLQKQLQSRAGAVMPVQSAQVGNGGPPLRQ